MKQTPWITISQDGPNENCVKTTTAQLYEPVITTVKGPDGKVTTTETMGKIYGTIVLLEARRLMDGFQHSSVSSVWISS